MSLEIPVGENEYESVSVLRHVHPSDNLWVAYDVTMIAAVLHFMHSGGFESSHQNRAEDLPKGVWSRKSGYLVTWIKPDGSKGYKTCKDLDEVASFKSSPAMNDCVADDGSDKDAAHDGK